METINYTIIKNGQHIGTVWNTSGFEDENGSIGFLMEDKNDYCFTTSYKTYTTKLEMKHKQMSFMTIYIKDD